MSNLIGGASFEVSVAVDDAIASFLKLRDAASAAFGEVRKALETAGPGQGFQLTAQLRDFKVLQTTLSAITGEIRQLNRGAEGVDLAEPFQKALDSLRVLQEEVQKGLGTPRASEEVARSQFLAESEALHEAAVAREELFQTAKVQAKEEEEIRKAVWLADTEGAHQAAIAREQLFEASRVRAREEEELNRRQFLAASNASHELALQKQRDFELTAKAAEDAANRERVAQERLGAELNAAINRINPGLAKERQEEFDQLAASASGVEEASGKLSGAFGRLAERGGFLGGVAGKLGGIFGVAEKTLKGFGFSISDVSVLLGTGFAGGVAGVILILQKFLRVFAQAVEEMAKMGAALTHLKNQISDTFVGATDQVNRFGREFANSLGLSEAAALTFIGRMGQLFQAQGETAEASAEISEGLLIAAGVFRQTTIGAGSYEQALRAVQNTVAGNIEGLREYNVLITEQELRTQASSRGINVMSGALDAQTRQYLAALEVIDQAQSRLEKQTEAERSLAEQTEKLSAVFTDIKTVVGQVFGAAFTAAVKIITPFFETIRAGVIRVRDTFAGSDSLQKVLSVFAAFLTQPFRNALKLAGAAITVFFDLVSDVIQLLDFALKPIAFIIDKLQKVVDGVTRALRAVGLLGDEESETAKKAKELAEAEREVEESARRSALAHEQTRENLQRLVDGYDDLNEAIKEAEKSEHEAEINLARVRDDNVRKIEDAQRSLKKAYADRNRAVEDANEKFHDIEIQNTRSLFDARKKLERSQLDAQRSIRDAEEKLADARIDAAKKVEKAEDDLAKARRDRLDKILEAQLTVGQAIRRGDADAENAARRELARAQRKDEIRDSEKSLEESQAETAKELARLERDLSEERVDARAKVRDAEIDLQRAQEDALERVKDAKREQARAFEQADERIAESRRRLHEVEVETNRAEFDAQQRLNEVREQGNEKVLEAIAHLKELNREFATTVEEAKVLLDFLTAVEENLDRQAARGHTSGFRGHGASEDFAHGGDLAFGRVGLTGERGRELVIGGSAGSTIFPNDLTEALIRLAKGESRAGGPSITINEVANDPEATAFAVSSRLARSIG